MNAINGRQLASKWLKSNALLTNHYIAQHIPKTKLFNSTNLRQMLARYGMVILKPVCGTGGHGVIKVEKDRRGYKLAYRTSRRRFSTFSSLIFAVHAQCRRRPYLIQRGIHLAAINGRPIDYRVKYVKLNGAWNIRAMVGRLARPGLFVTNLCRGGTLMIAAQGISRSLSSRIIGSKKREMRHLTQISTGLLERRFPGIGQLGYDYGIDRKGHIWMLEVNTRPH